jgi:SAM-dependent methyltransferase
MVSGRLPLRGIVLDIGAGKGDASHPCRRSGITLIGVDESWDVKENQNLDEYLVQDAESLPFESETIDLVFSDFTFEHLESPRLVVSEIQRVLKPQGFLVFRTVNILHYVALSSILMPDTFRDDAIEISGRTAADCFPTFYRLNSKRTISRVLQQDGFEIEEIVRIEGPPDYLSFSNLFYRIGVAYERIANSTERLGFLRANLLVAARRL